MQLADLSSGNLMLTGATGVLGAHMLKELLSNTKVDIYCLVRSETEEAARIRLKQLLSSYDPQDELGVEFESRVVPVLGDIILERLGLSESAYAALADTIDVVVHGAAMTNLFARFSKIEPINVGGTRNVIEFTLKTRHKYLCYISTYTVMGDRTFDGNFLFRETDYDVGQAFDHMTYQQTKFIAEGLVRGASERGLQWKIIRPGQIFGDSQTGDYPQGQTNVSGLFYDIWKTVIESRVALTSNTYYDITPVDYVSRATVHHALRDRAVGVTYHLTNPDHTTYTDIIQMVVDMGYPIQFVNQDEYKKMLFDRELKVDGVEYKSYTTQAFKWWFRREKFDFNNSAKTDSTLARAVLEPRGIHCPRIDPNLLGVYIERGVKDKYFPAAPLRVAKDRTQPLRAAAR